MRSEWHLMKASDFIAFNPKESISKNIVAKKVSMDKLQPFTRDIHDYTLEPFTGGAKFRNGDTIIARITPCLENGKTAQINILDEGEVAFGSTEFIVLRAKPGISDRNFIYYLSISPILREPAIKSMVGSSGRQRVQQDVLSNLGIYLPPLPEQTAIGAVLSALDDKIELNNRINQKLEEMAQTIFKSWFVDFEPFQDGEFVESQLGLIPKGWRVYRLEEFFPVITGKKNANISSSVGKYPFFSCSQGFSWTNDYSFEGPAILVAGNGDFNVKWCNKKFEAYQRTYVLKPYESILTGFLFYAVQYSLSQITSGARGSVIKFITKGNIADFEIAAPKKLKELGLINTFATINEVIENCNAESYRLAFMRDTLLPKLMSGELRVPCDTE